MGNKVPAKVGKKKLLENTRLEVVCEECGAPYMLVRTNRATQGQFLGCPNYPDCTGTAKIPEDVRMRLEGATPLPGIFDTEGKINSPFAPEEGL